MFLCVLFKFWIICKASSLDWLFCWTLYMTSTELSSILVYRRKDHLTHLNAVYCLLPYIVFVLIQFLDINFPIYPAVIQLSQMFLWRLQSLLHCLQIPHDFYRPITCLYVWFIFYSNLTFLIFNV